MKKNNIFSLLPFFYSSSTSRALWITRKRVPHSLRSLRSLRVRPWITASRYPPASLRLLVIQRMTGATWRRLFSICLRRPCRGPLAAVRLGEQAWRASPFVLAPLAQAVRCGSASRGRVLDRCAVCGPHQPLDPAPSLESHEKRPESPDMTFSKRRPCWQAMQNGSPWAVSGCFPAEPVGKAGMRSFPRLSAGRQRVQRGVSK